MQTPLLIPPLVAAIILIVFGRVNHRKTWGNWVAVAGYTLLAITIVLGVLSRR